jgi:hypothetical protein
MATLVSKIKNEPPGQPPYSHVGNQSNGVMLVRLKSGLEDKLSRPRPSGDKLAMRMEFSSSNLLIPQVFRRLNSGWPIAT